MDPDVVSSVGEDDYGHGGSTDGFVGHGVVVSVSVAPHLPGSQGAQQQWDQAEVRDGGVAREQSGAEGNCD